MSAAVRVVSRIIHLMAAGCSSRAPGSMHGVSNVGHLQIIQQATALARVRRNYPLAVTGRVSRRRDRRAIPAASGRKFAGRLGLTLHWLRAVMGGYTGGLPMSPENQGRQFRFGVFEANEAVGELRKEGVRLKLHSQPFQVLVMLLERPSELVTREEMRQRLWGDDTIVDFDHGLNTAVNKIREALCEVASQPRYVETVSGRGYRFIAQVTVAEPVSSTPVELST